MGPQAVLQLTGKLDELTDAEVRGSGPKDLQAQPKSLLWP